MANIAKVGPSATQCQSPMKTVRQMETRQYRQDGSKRRSTAISHENHKRVLETGQYHQNEFVDKSVDFPWKS